MKSTSLQTPKVAISEDWEVQVRAYFEMMNPEEKADTIARIKQLVLEWEKDSGLDMLKYQKN